MKVIIVGGVAGGASAATRLRRLNEQAEIIIFERSGFVSYANCGLPYFVGDVITDPEELTLQSPESLFRRFRIDVRVKHEVTQIHPERKAVSVRNLETGEVFEESYEKLILSPGAKAIKPSLVGCEDRVFTLRTVEDTLRIKNYIDQKKPKTAVLAGGGFISLELAENLREQGINVTVVQSANQLMNPFDPEMAAFIHNELRRQGVNIFFGHAVEEIKGHENGVEVVLSGECILHADMAALAIGVTSISLRRREFAMLRSVGMTEKGINKMMNYECILYGAKALLLGLPTSCLISFILYKIVSKGMMISFKLPWLAMGIATLSVFLVVFATMIYAMHKIKKENPIDALKNENI